MHYPIEEALASGAFARDPHRMYQRLRETAPVYWSEHLGQWLVTSYELVEEVLLQPTRYSSYGFDLAYISRLPDTEHGRLSTLEHHFRQRGLIQADPPEHTRLRRAMSRDFSVHSLAHLEPRIRSIADELLDAVDGDFDVIPDFARPLPVNVIAELLGVSDVDRREFPIWSDDAVRFFGSPTPDPADARRLNDDLVAWRALLRRLLVDRSTVAGHNLLGKLGTLVEGGTVSIEEAVFTGVHLLIAGHETTTNLIGNALLCLLARPEQLEQVRESPADLANAIEETLRFEPPIQRVRRVATETSQLGGETVRAGEAVIPVLSAANRDPARFTRPDEFDLDRDFSHPPHVAFGKGVHFCIGAPLARLEAPTALTAVLERYPDIGLVEGFTPRWRSTINLRGLTSLPVH